MITSVPSISRRGVIVTIVLALVSSVCVSAQSHDTLFLPPSGSIDFPEEHENLRPESRAALRGFPDVDPLIIGDHGTPFFLRGDFGKIASSGRETSIADLRKVLPKIAPMIALEPGQLQHVGDELDQVEHRHFYFQLSFRGREIVKASLLMHVDQDGHLYMVNGSIPDESDEPPFEAQLSRDQARSLVRGYLQKDSLGNSSERLVYLLPNEGAKLSLTWEVTYPQHIAGATTMAKTYVDAITGDHILTDEPIYHARQRSVRNATGVNSAIMLDEQTGQLFLPPTIARSEGQGATSFGAVNAAYDNLGQTYDYFSQRFSYDGPNGNGSTINATANSLFRFYNPSPPSFFVTGQNSFFTKAQFGSQPLTGYLYFGTGPSTSANLSTSHSSAVDIVGHEYTHWILEDRTLGPLGSGAVNEGLSDVFGAMIERRKKGNVTDANVWLMGETTGSVIRNMAVPNEAAGQKNYFPEYNTSQGPHAGATIVGLAFKLLSTGGTHPDLPGKPPISVPGIGESNAEQIFFHAIRFNLPTGASFQSLKHTTAASGAALYGTLTRNKVYYAWDAVGVPYGSGSLRAISISTRAWVGTGSDVLISGLSLSGSGSKPILIRGVGPTLGNPPFNIPGVLADPELVVIKNGATVASNDNWGGNSAIASAAASVGAFALPPTSLDSAVLPTLTSGLYTATVSGKNNGTGVALVEAYDTNTSTSQRFVAISTRAKVRTTDPIIAGIAVSGNTGKKLLIRAVGPTLGSFGVPGTLSNPQLSLVSQDGHQLYFNDNWGQWWDSSALQAATSQVGAFSLQSGSADSAMLVELPPGLYTAIAFGGNGVALVEVYEVP